VACHYSPTDGMELQLVAVKRSLYYLVGECP